MKNILLINAHHYYPFAEGKLNETLCTRARNYLIGQGCEVKTTVTQSGYSVEEELTKHQWADAVILQSPINWMMVPWSFKKYMDEVYTAGMAGALCNGDGRHEHKPKENYGNGGTLTGVKYMLSLTFNAPEESFNNPDEFLFQGKSVDDLLFPVHMNFRFFAMQPLPTFAAFDVMKNIDIKHIFQSFDTHMEKVFSTP